MTEYEIRFRNEILKSIPEKQISRFNIVSLNPNLDTLREIHVSLNESFSDPHLIALDAAPIIAEALAGELAYKALIDIACHAIDGEILPLSNLEAVQNKSHFIANKRAMD